VLQVLLRLALEQVLALVQEREQVQEQRHLLVLLLSVVSMVQSQSTTSMPHLELQLVLFHLLR
jgi:hypothetical protein